MCKILTFVIFFFFFIFLDLIPKRTRNNTNHLTSEVVITSGHCKKLSERLFKRHLTKRMYIYKSYTWWGFSSRIIKRYAVSQCQHSYKWVRDLNRHLFRENTLLTNTSFWQQCNNGQSSGFILSGIWTLEKKIKVFFKFYTLFLLLKTGEHSKCIPNLFILRRKTALLLT